MKKKMPHTNIPTWMEERCQLTKNRGLKFGTTGFYIYQPPQQTAVARHSLLKPETTITKQMASLRDSLS
jgi:hypothetical protein